MSIFGRRRGNNPGLATGSGDRWGYRVDESGRAQRVNDLTDDELGYKGAQQQRTEEGASRAFRTLLSQARGVAMPKQVIENAQQALRMRGIDYPGSDKQPIDPATQRLKDALEMGSTQGNASSWADNIKSRLSPKNPIRVGKL